MCYSPKSRSSSISGHEWSRRLAGGYSFADFVVFCGEESWAWNWLYFLISLCYLDLWPLPVNSDDKNETIRWNKGWLWPTSKTGWGSQAFGRVWLKPLLFKMKKSQLRCFGNLTWCLLDVSSVRSFGHIRNFQADPKHTGEIMSLNQRDGWVERSLEICYTHEPNSCILLKRNGWSFLLSLLQHQTTHRYS